MSERTPLSVFGDIDERYVKEAETAKVKTVSRWLTVAAAVAVMALTVGFAVEQFVMPPITAGDRTHLCEVHTEPSEEEFGLTRRHAPRIRYEGRWYSYGGPCSWKPPVGETPLTTVYRDAGCTACDGTKGGREDVAGVLFAVPGMEPSEFVLMRYVDGHYLLFAAQDLPVAENGRELFDERYAVCERTVEVRAQTYRDALDGAYPTMTMAVEDPLTVRFLEALCEAELTEELQSKAQASYVMDLHLDNGMTVHLSLKWGGYVSCKGQVFRIDRELYDAVMARLEEQR